MKWIKKGRIFTTERQHGWMNSHAQCPTAVVLDDRIRIYFSARLENQQSLPTFVDVDKRDPKRVLALNPEPILERGRRGTFDENGIIPSYFVRKGEELYFYYAGWSQCRNVPYKNFTGMAVSRDNGATFIKYSEAPVFSMNAHDPLSATGPCIVKMDDRYAAVYSTGIEWIEIEGKLEHTYLLTTAASDDAIHWMPSGVIAIQAENEFVAHCKPAILHLDGIYHMWFSKRGSHHFRSSGSTAYRIGYATSLDMVHWTRDDANAGIDVSTEGWDSEMICYPHVVTVDGTHMMFYNGNGFGKSGFGYAVLEP